MKTGEPLRKLVGFRMGWGCVVPPLLAAIAFLMITLWIRAYERASLVQSTSATVALYSMHAYHLVEANIRDGALRMKHAGHPEHRAQPDHVHESMTLEEALERLREGAHLLQTKFGERPHTDRTFLSAPFTVTIDTLGLAEIPQDLRQVWEGAAGQPSIGALLNAQIDACLVSCGAFENLPPDAARYVDGLSEVAVSQMQPRLLALNVAGVRWADEMLFKTRLAIVIAVLSVIAGIMITRIRIVEPLLQRLDDANAELQERNQSLEKRVEARTSQLTEALAHANAANAARARLLASVNHELRTPMNGVLGVAALLERTKLDGRQTALVGTVIESGQTLLRLIDDVMDIVCADADEIRINEQPGDVAQLVRRTLDLLHPVAAAKGLALRVETAQAPDCPVMIDADRLAQILNNVVGNAIKFTDEGHVGVGLHLVERPEAVVAEITVQDTGPGIDPDTQAVIFDPFERGSGGAIAPGTGLGLAITRSLVQRMGGTIEVDSAPGCGSCFIIRLPMRRADGGVGSLEGAAA